MHTHIDKDNSLMTLLFGPALSISSIVARIYQSNDSNSVTFPGPPPREAPNRAKSQPVLAAHDFRPLVEVLRCIHQAASEREIGGSHENIHQPLQDLEAKLREHTTTVEQLLASSESDQPILHALQQTLFLQCPRGGRTAGQFRCINRTGTAARVDIRSHGAVGDDDPRNEPIVTFEPTNQRLEPEESCLVRATVDLANCPNAGNKSIEICSDIYLNNKITLRLVICVDIYDFEKQEKGGTNG